MLACPEPAVGRGPARAEAGVPRSGHSAPVAAVRHAIAGDMYLLHFRAHMVRTAAQVGLEYLELQAVVAC